MNYAKIKDGAIAEFPLSEDQIKKMFPNTSFTIPFEPPSGFVLVDSSPEPDLAWDEIAIEVNPTYVDGTWTSSWQIEKVSDAVAQRLTEDKAVEERNKRAQLLERSDWTQLPDAPVDTALWATYRQELRDITKQSDFPWSVNWPVHPLG